MVYSLTDKPGPVRDVLVKKDDNWEEWGLEELMENLQKYVERNPLRERDDSSKKDDIPRSHPWKRDSEREKMLRYNRQSRPNHKPTCVYCNSSEISDFKMSDNS